MKKQVAVIGGGASGLTAAIWAARSGASVMIIEHTDRVGKKLLSTGNGRCNLTNSRMEETCYRSGVPGFPMEAIQQFGWKDTIKWFASMGVLCKNRMETYYYPISDQASAVLDVLRLECQRLGIKMIMEWKPDKILAEKKKGKPFFVIMGNQGKILADSLVFACGSKAAPGTGSDGSGYKLAEMMGHHIIKPLPALVQLRCQGKYYKHLAGIRTEVKLCLVAAGREEAREEGELQITDYGISGIPVFQISRFAARALDAGKKVQVFIDFLPFMDEEESRIFLNERFIHFGERNGEDFLTGVVNKKLAQVLLKLAKIPADRPVCETDRHQREQLFLGLKHYEALISSVNPFTNAQVCCGGVDVSEVNPRTMESLLIPELFFSGEILDVDGICGGYNLQWAWSSGKVAGTQAAQWSSQRKEKGGRE